MKDLVSRPVVGMMVFILLFLTACVWPEKSNDPFERLPEEKLQTIEGTIYPFSVSVKTSATHRLEKDNRLVAFLASKIVRLEDFEGRKVELDGMMRTEKMREIFWVEAIRLQDIISLEELEPDSKRYATNSFSFTHPSHWEYTTAPNGTVYFKDRNDAAGRVFLTFTPSELESGDTNIETNVLISNMAGTKEISTDDSGSERQELELFSNISNQKYSFLFLSPFEDFERKQAFFKLLNSFIEGEEKVKEALEADKKEEAERQEKQAEFLRLQELLEQLQNGGLEVDEEDEDSDDEPLDVTNQEEEAPSVDAPVSKPADTAVDFELGSDFTNIIDDRAFYYESSHYQFSMTSPYGYWFRNFGPVEGAIAKIAFAKQEITSLAMADFSLNIVSGDYTGQPVETLEGGVLTIKAPRSDKTYYEVTGSPLHRDAMWSVVSSITTF